MRRGPKDYRSDCHQNAVCDVCGFKFKASEMRLMWNGLRVCDKDFETRQPQDLIKGIIDHQTPKWIRDQVEPIYISIGKPDGSVL